MKLRKLIILPVLLLFVLSCNNNDNPAPDEFVFPSKVINRIMVDSSGLKWFATEKGVISYDGARWTTYTDDKSLSNGPIADLAFGLTSGINSLLLASNVGLSVFGFGAATISFQNFNKTNSEILEDTVTAIGVDGSNVKYVGTTKGLSILKDGKWDEFFGRRNQEILLRYKISSVGPASKGYVYITTEGGGVSRYCDAVSGQTTLNKPWAWGLPSDTVYTVIITQDTCQWYGTAKGVGYHMSPDTKNDWTTYTRADGLICDSVYAIAKDLSGDMWFGTHKGVSKLHMGTDTTWTSYTTKDGLVANKINAIAADLDGSVWFGTDEGISHLSNNKWEKY
jgi:ligand-binding sensor domain-containing protein